MQRKILFYLLILFTIYLIINDASGSGEHANAFFDWVGGGLTKTREFVNATLGDAQPTQVP